MPTTNSTSWLASLSTGVDLAPTSATAFLKRYGIKLWP
jgi:hypothetical protein